jgi:hypothetical protein
VEHVDIEEVKGVVEAKGAVTEAAMVGVVVVAEVDKVEDTCLLIKNGILCQDMVEEEAELEDEAGEVGKEMDTTRGEEMDTMRGEEMDTTRGEEMDTVRGHQRISVTDR